MPDPSAIALEGTATYAGDLATGVVFLLTVTRGDAHITDGSTVTLTVLASDTRHTQFLASHQAPAVLRLRFTRLRDGEPYATMPITGFVDDSMTSWQLESIREG